SAEHADEAVQRLCGRRLVLYQRHADVTRTRIAAASVLARKIAARDHPQAGLAPQPQRYRFIAAMRRAVEPEQEAARGTMIAIAAAEDLVGEIELECIEPPVVFHMGLVAIGCNGDPLRRDRHLR